MRLQVSDVTARILEKISANTYDSTWTTKALNYFHKNLVTVIQRGEYSLEEIFGLLKGQSVTVGTSPVAIYGTGTDNPLKVIRLVHTDNKVRFYEVELSELEKKLQNAYLMPSDGVIYYSVYGKSIYFAYKTICSPATASAIFIEDLPASLTSASYLTDYLTAPIIYRVIDLAAQEMLDILNRSA